MLGGEGDESGEEIQHWRGWYRAAMAATSVLRTIRGLFHSSSLSDTVPAWPEYRVEERGWDPRNKS
jgi:hypothetical protein